MTLAVHFNAIRAHRSLCGDVEEKLNHCRKGCKATEQPEIRELQCGQNMQQRHVRLRNDTLTLAAHYQALHWHACLLSDSYLFRPCN